MSAVRCTACVYVNGSFGRAAASLNLSNTAVTRYVALLETHLKTRLVNRTTRSLSLTEAGLAYAGGLPANPRAARCNGVSRFEKRI
ncbi:MAG TPA: LysR family transcriptional regulator [Paraburkholderia sp.]|nr:LysR family transcriptional regulator [Paraburkholderia sp.]